MPKQLTTPTTYRTLVSKISKELTELDSFVRRRTAEGYWRIGKYIHDHLLEHKDRAEYGASIYERLENEVDRDATTLTRMVQFYRAYQIHAPAHELSWGHYRSLITIKDKDQRSRLEREIVRKNWDTRKVREYLSVKRELPGPDEPVPQLKFTRGRLHTYQIVKANQPLAKISPLVLDLGFRLQYLVPGGEAKNSLSTNAIWFGSNVNVEDVKLVAYTLIRAGIKIKTIKYSGQNSTQ